MTIRRVPTTPAFVTPPEERTLSDGTPTTQRSADGDSFSRTSSGQSVRSQDAPSVSSGATVRAGTLASQRSAVSSARTVDLTPVDEAALLASLDKRCGPGTTRDLQSALASEPWSTNPRLRQTLLRGLQSNVDAHHGRDVDSTTKVEPELLREDLEMAAATARTLSTAQLDAPTTAKLACIVLTANDPAALALVKRGTLLDAQDFHGKKLIDHLDQLATAPVGSGVDRRAIVRDVVLDVLDPPTMAQGNKGTCAATSCAYTLCTERPAEYARLVCGLASESGSVTLANGARIEVEKERDADGRRTSGALLFPALMEYANATQDYHNAEDAHFDANGNAIHSGLFLGQIQHLREGLFGKTARVMIKDPAAFAGSEVDPITSDAGKANTIFQRSLVNGKIDFTRAKLFTPEEYLRGPFAKRAVLAMDFQIGGHAVVFESFGNDGRVYFFNPWGGTDAGTHDQWKKIMPGLRFEDEKTGLQSLPQAEFFQRCFGVVR